MDFSVQGFSTVLANGIYFYIWFNLVNSTVFLTNMQVRKYLEDIRVLATATSILRSQTYKNYAIAQKLLS